MDRLERAVTAAGEWLAAAATGGPDAPGHALREAGAAPIALYVAALSLAGFALMGRDKRAARRSARRVPEKTLLIIALIGGAPGIWLGMRAFRHKTRHGWFRAGVPAMLAAHLLLLGWLLAG